MENAKGCKDLWQRDSWWLTFLYLASFYLQGLNSEGKTLAPPRLKEDMRRYEFQPDFYSQSVEMK
jgi:hypothetical protein